MDEQINLDTLGTRLEQDCMAADHVYIHWTAGHYGQHYDDYHINIDSDGSVFQTLPLWDTPSATWHRNAGSIAITLDCCPDASIWKDGHVDFGTEPPTDAQIEALAQVLATISNHLGIPIDPLYMMTHAEAAELDGYGPNTTCERWDLWALPGSTEWGSGGDYIRGKALFYQQEWEAENE